MMRRCLQMHAGHSYFSDGTNDKIQAVIEAGICQRLVELLLHRSPSVLIPALRTVRNIVTGDDGQTQCVGHLSLSLHNPWRSLWRFFEAIMGMHQLLDNLSLALVTEISGRLLLRPALQYWVLNFRATFTEDKG